MNLKIKHILSGYLELQLLLQEYAFVIFIHSSANNEFGFMTAKLENILSSKIGMPVSIEGLKFSSHPDLSFDF